MNKLSKWANDWGREMGIYGVSTEDKPAGIDDDLDAFRHAFSHAVVVAWLPFAETDKEISDWIGEFMEVEEIFGASAQMCARFMDLHNNKVGRDLAPDNKQMFYILATYENPNFYIAKIIAAAVKEGKTINSLDDPRMPKECHILAKVPGGDYIWRTKRDDKVRWNHAVKEGKTFNLKDPEKPGAEFGCRCVAEPIIKPKKP